MTAATPAQRKAAERARQAEAGLAEVRLGIYAPPEHHAEIKRAAVLEAEKLARKRAKTPTKE